jgi:hypothetical protein
MKGPPPKFAAKTPEVGPPDFDWGRCLVQKKKSAKEHRCDGGHILRPSGWHADGAQQSCGRLARLRVRWGVLGAAWPQPPRTASSYRAAALKFFNILSKKFGLTEVRGAGW